jgi:hypothetical protein
METWWRVLLVIHKPGAAYSKVGQFEGYCAEVALTLAVQICTPDEQEHIHKVEIERVSHD